MEETIWKPCYKAQIKLKSLPRVSRCQSADVYFPTPVRRCVAGENLNKENYCSFESFLQVEKWSHFLPKLRQHRLAQLYANPNQISTAIQYKQKRLPIIYRYFYTSVQSFLACWERESLKYILSGVKLSGFRPLSLVNISCELSLQMYKSVMWLI